MKNENIVLLYFTCPLLVVVLCLNPTLPAVELSVRDMLCSGFLQAVAFFLSSCVLKKSCRTASIPTEEADGSI